MHGTVSTTDHVRRILSSMRWKPAVPLVMPKELGESTTSYCPRSTPPLCPPSTRAERTSRYKTARIPIEVGRRACTSARQRKPAQWRPSPGVSATRRRGPEAAFPSLGSGVNTLISNPLGPQHQHRKLQVTKITSLSGRTNGADVTHLQHD